jgi:hypothetical protein
MNAEILPTRRAACFWGTIEAEGRADVNAAWTLTFRALLAATGCSANGVRDFMDSRFGVYFADDLMKGLKAGEGLESAIEAAINLWKGRKISRTESHLHGIPEGTDDLTGWISCYARISEAA